MRSPSSAASTRCVRAITPNASLSPRLRHRPERRRVDEVVRGLSAPHLIRLMSQAHLPQERERLRQLVRCRRVERPGRRRSRQPVQRLLGRDARLHPFESRDAADDRDPSVLHVQAADVLALALDDQIPQEARRRPVGERAVPQVPQERRVVAGPADRGLELGLGIERTGDAAEVVDDRGQDAAGRAEVAPPRVHRVGPPLDGSPHRRVRRHGIALATRDAGLLEPSGHVLRELGQRCVDRLDRPLLRVVRERVVLIGGERLLPPRGAPEREPRPRRRGFAEPFDREREEPRGHRVDDERHDAADAHRLGARVDERKDDLGESSAGGDDLIARACTFDLAADRERRVAADVHQIRRRHDTDDRPVRTRHGEVVHAFGEHGHQRLADQRVLGQRLHGERRDLLHGRLRAPMRREHARTEVVVGHDAPPLVSRDEEARDVLRRHALGGGRHGHPLHPRRPGPGGPTLRRDGTAAPAAPSTRARRPAAHASCPGRTTGPRTSPGSRRPRRHRSGSRACPRGRAPWTSGSPPPAGRTARTPRRRSGGRRACPRR